MKTFIVSILMMSVWTGIIYAQVPPEKVKYQAIVRNPQNGIPFSNSSVSIKFSVLIGSDTGIPAYIETHNVTTNFFGLISLHIGEGEEEPSTGAFSEISWGESSFFLKVEFMPPNSNEYSLMGVSEIVSVPYAFHAKTAQTVEQENQTLELNGDVLSISDGNTVQLSGLSCWSCNDNTIFTTEKNVGIGTNSPDPSIKFSIRLPDGAGLGKLASFRKDYRIGNQSLFSNSLRIEIDPAMRRTFIRSDGSNGVPSLEFGAGPNAAHMTILPNGNVGIGTTTPTANLELHGTAKVLGAWDDNTLQPNNAYQASSDGFVQVQVSVSATSLDKMGAEGYTDGNASPTTLRAGATAWSNVNHNSFTMPVRNGDYWRVIITAQDFSGNITISWIPLGIN